MSSGPPWEHRGRGPEQLQSHPPGLVLGNVIDGEPGALPSPGGSRRCSSQPGHREDSPLSHTLGDRLITQIPGARGSLPPGPPSFLSLPGLPVSPFLTSPFPSLVHSLVSLIPRISKMLPPGDTSGFTEGPAEIPAGASRDLLDQA